MRPAAPDAADALSIATRAGGGEANALPHSVRTRIDYGRDGLDIRLPEGDTRILEMAHSDALARVEERLEYLLQHPIGTPSLASLARGRENACVVISDITRPVPNRVILPPLLKLIEEAGIAVDRITILVGTGLHRPNEGEELIQLVGEEIASSYRIVNHRARERETLAYLGDTSAAAPIWIDRIYVNADLKIATSLIEPHLMAGFSGGRKAICPGLAGVETMRVLHGPELLAHPRAAEGRIEGNPFHRQALEVAHKAGVDFTLNVTMNDRRQITGIFCGDLEKAHAEGVAFAEKCASAWVDEPVDVVVTSSAGFPLDLTFYQAVKGLTAVLPIVREGGAILMAARCEEGLGSDEFTELLLNMGTPDDFSRRLREPGFFRIDQWQVQELCKVLSKVSVGLFSEGIPAESASRLPVELIPSIEAGLEAAQSRCGTRLAVVPRGPYVLTRLRGEGA